MENDLNIPDGIYYIVLADMVGSTKFGATWGNAALAGRIDAFVNASKKSLEYARTASNTGRFLKSVGDGVLLIFNHFPDIVQWGLEFDATLQFIYGEPIRTRLCVHAGELLFHRGDTLNLATNQVSKMEKHVKAGELVLSHVAFELAKPSMYPKQCEFKRHGSVEIPGYERPMDMYQLVMTSELAFLIDKTGRGRKRTSTR